MFRLNALVPLQTISNNTPTANVTISRAKHFNLDKNENDSP